MTALHAQEGTKTYSDFVLPKPLTIQSHHGQESTVDVFISQANRHLLRVPWRTRKQSQLLVKRRFQGNWRVQSSMRMFVVNLKISAGLDIKLHFLEYLPTGHTDLKFWKFTGYPATQVDVLAHNGKPSVQCRIRNNIGITLQQPPCNTSILLQESEEVKNRWRLQWTALFNGACYNASRSITCTPFPQGCFTNTSYFSSHLFFNLSLKAETWGIMANDRIKPMDEFDQLVQLSGSIW